MFHHWHSRTLEVVVYVHERDINGKWAAGGGEGKGGRGDGGAELPDGSKKIKKNKLKAPPIICYG